MSNDCDTYQCRDCGFMAEFSDPYAITIIERDIDISYIECVFCKGMMRRRIRSWVDDC